MTWVLSPYLLWIVPRTWRRAIVTPDRAPPRIPEMELQESFERFRVGQAEFDPVAHELLRPIFQVPPHSIESRIFKHFNCRDLIKQCRAIFRLSPIERCY